MAHRKLEMGRLFAKTQTRIASLQGIDKQLSLGNGLALEDYQSAYEDLQSSVVDYNEALARLVAKRNSCTEKARSVKEMDSRMLAGVGVKYGKESTEYEQAGGTRPSVRKRNKTARKAS